MPLLPLTACNRAQTAAVFGLPQVVQSVQVLQAFRALRSMAGALLLLVAARIAYHSKFYCPDSHHQQSKPANFLRLCMAAVSGLRPPQPQTPLC